mgnify:CR=1 FL=1
MTDPLNNIFDDFGLWLLGYRNEFSCTDEYAKATFKVYKCSRFNQKYGPFSNNSGRENAKFFSVNMLCFWGSSFSTLFYWKLSL